MGFFSFLFGGKYPSTKKYEAQQAGKLADYERFKQLAVSTDLARYKELEALTNSADFQARVNKLKTERFRDTEAYRKEQEYIKLRKSDEIYYYLKFKSKGLDQKYQQAVTAPDYNRYLELDKVINSPEFEEKRKAKDFKKTDDYQLLKEYDKVRKCSNTKFVKKTEKSDMYKNFIQIDGSEKLKHFYELEQYVNSAEFKAFKAEMEDSKRFKKSEECRTLEEFATLTKSKDLIWYFEKEKADAFADVRKWKLVFEDHFEGFDHTTWMLGYYNGNALAQKVYSDLNERQAFSHNNIACAGSELSIITRKEAAQGIRWTPTLGFVKDDFEYTSALINTGNSFRQQYGRFDFKVKPSQSKIVSHNIWLSGEKNVPLVSVMSFGLYGKNAKVGIVSKNGTKTALVDGANFASDYYVFSLLWTPEKLVWSVNGVEVCTIRENIPQEPLFINLSSNITEQGDAQNCDMKFDWIKVYTWAK